MCLSPLPLSLSSARNHTFNHAADAAADAVSGSSSFFPEHLYIESLPPALLPVCPLPSLPIANFESVLQRAHSCLGFSTFHTTPKKGQNTHSYSLWRPFAPNKPINSPSTIQRRGSVLLHQSALSYLDSWPLTGRFARRFLSRLGGRPSLSLSLSQRPPGSCCFATEPAPDPIAVAVHDLSSAAALALVPSPVRLVFALRSSNRTCRPHNARLSAAFARPRHPLRQRDASPSVV